MRALRWMWAANVLWLLSPATGLAQNGGEASAIERARTHMERGQALYLQARFEESAAEFEAAFEAQPFSAFLYNAGVSLERAGQPDRAADLFEQYLERDPQASDAEAVRARIERLRASLREGSASTGSGAEGEATERDGSDTAESPGEVGADGQAAVSSDGGATEGQPGTDRAPEPSEGVPEDFKSLLSVRTNPEGAVIRVQQEGQTVAEGPSPFAHTLDQGRYRVFVEHPDYQTVEQDVRIEPGKVYVVIVEMSQGQFLGYLRVVSNVPGADVYIDDREQGPRGQTPFEAPIPVGAHRLWVERPGYQLEESEIEVGIGEDVTARVDLERVPFGRLRVVANVPGARVLVDGRLVGTVPFEGRVPAGARRLRVEADGMKAFEVEVTIERGQLTPTRVRLRPAVGQGGAWATTVFAALFVGGGVALSVLANDWSNQLAEEQAAGRLASDDARIDQGIYFSIGADAAFGLSLILGALALYYFFYDPLPPSDGRVLEARDWAILPMVDPVSGAAGVGLGGRF